MKKLMIATILACASTLAMGDCEIEGAECVYAYRLKLVGKTVKGKELDAKSACESAACWGKTASFRVAGYVYNDGKELTDVECECDCPCEGHLDLADNKCVFWDQDKKQFFCDVDAIEIDVYDILRNSGYKDKCQLGFKIGDIYLGGIGSYNPVTKRLKRAYGYFAGTYGQPTCLGSACDAEAVAAMVFKPCDIDNAAECEKAVVFGRWKMAWKGEKVAMLKKGVDPLTPGCLVPMAFVPNNEG